MEHRVAVMMLAGQYPVLHTGAFSHSRNRGCVPVDRIKGARGRVILVHRDALRVRQRAHASDQRPRQLEPALAAMPPMDEHPESCLVEPRIHNAALSLSSDAVVHTGGLS